MGETGDPPIRTHTDWYLTLGVPTVERRAFGSVVLVDARNQPALQVVAPPLDTVTLQVGRGRGAHRLDFGEGAFEAAFTHLGAGFVISPAAHANAYETRQPLDLLSIDIPGWSNYNDEGDIITNFSGLHHQMYYDPLVEGLARQLWEMSLDSERLTLDAMVLTLFALVSRLGLRVDRNCGGLAPWQLRRVTDFMRDHYSLDTSIEELAQLVKLSPFHFARQFKRATGMPPRTYQRRLRVEKAQQMMLESDLPIGEIAACVGYDTPHAFSRMFRALVGASPSEWRRDTTSKMRD